MFFRDVQIQRIGHITYRTWFSKNRRDKKSKRFLLYTMLYYTKLIHKRRFRDEINDWATRPYDYHILILIRLSRVRTCVWSSREKDGTIMTSEKIVKVWSRQIALFQLKTRLPPPFRCSIFRSNFYSLHTCNTDEIKRCDVANCAI